MLSAKNQNDLTVIIGVMHEQNFAKYEYEMNFGGRTAVPLQWRHNGRKGVSNHQPRDCLLNRLFGRRSKKALSSASLAFVRGIHRGPVNSSHKWPVTRKMFPFDDVIMLWSALVKKNTIQINTHLTVRTLRLCTFRPWISTVYMLWFQYTEASQSEAMFENLSQSTWILKGFYLIIHA